MTGSSQFEAVKTSYEEIEPLRSQFLDENRFQIRYDSCHWRGWSDSYHLMVDGRTVGYGSVKGKEELADRNTIFEFFVQPAFRALTSSLFSELIRSLKCSIH